MIILNGDEVAIHSNDLYSVFEKSAERYPDALAVRDCFGDVTYRELRVMVERLDSALAQHSLCRVDRIAVHLKPGRQVLCALLASLRRRVPYAPIDHRLPASRLESLLTSLDPKIILTERRQGKEKLMNWSDRLLDVDAAISNRDLKLAARPNLDTDDLAYVMYTSGSTGTPKGVMVPVLSLMNYLCWAEKYYVSAKGMGSVIFTPTSFDMTVTSLFLPLFHGKAVLFSELEDVVALANTLNSNTEKLSFLKLTPSALSMLLELIPAKELNKVTNRVILGGEIISTGLIEGLAPCGALPIINEYGPTETTVGSAYFSFCATDAPANAPIPAGKPIWNTAIAVIDSNNSPTMSNGEILISGGGLASGYFQDEKQTSHNFRVFPNISSDIWYKTGDIGWVNGEKNLVCEGRNENYLKVNGYRVSLLQISRTIEENPEVVQAYTIAAEGKDAKLAGITTFVVLRKGCLSVAHEDLVLWCDENMEPHTRPDIIKVISNFPITTNGKIDHHFLLEILEETEKLAPPAERKFGGKEQSLSTAWKKILNVDIRAGSESFFASGGDSISALKFVIEAKSAGYALSILDILQFRSFDKICEAAKPIATEIPKRSAFSGPVGLLPNQKAYFSLGFSNMTGWALCWSIDLEEERSSDEISSAIVAVLNTHTALRSQFHFVNGNWECEISEPVNGVELETYPVNAGNSDEIALEIGRIFDKISSELELRGDQLIRFFLAELPNDKRIVGIATHHLLVDVVSLQGIERDLRRYLQGDKQWSSRGDDLAYIELAQAPPDKNAKEFPPIGSSLALEQITEGLGIEISENILSSPAGGSKNSLTLLVCAVIEALKTLPAFHGFDQVCIELQGRGRTHETSHLIETVGWLTDYQTVSFSTDESLQETYLRVKDSRNSHGETVDRMTLPSVCINYLGAHVDDGTVLNGRALGLGEEVQLECAQLFPLEIILWYDGGILRTLWKYRKSAFQNQNILALFSEFKNQVSQCLNDLPAHLTEISGSEYVQSEGDLRRILEDFEE
jgi:amino acid adenylation domain-containing protein